MKVKNTCATFAFCALSVLSVSGKNNCSQEQFINLLNIIAAIGGSKKILMNIYIIKISM